LHFSQRFDFSLRRRELPDQQHAPAGERSGYISHAVGGFLKHCVCVEVHVIAP